jgi:hypothetical protein
MLPALLIKGSALVAKRKFKGLGAPGADVVLAVTHNAEIFCPAARVVYHYLAAEPARLQQR